MTSRLKRKLGEIGVDLSSRKANENFCLIGTPLPPLEKSKDIGEFVPLWKQDVRDEKGRRRLHGAFTGGFSAGYFNTVGSKEGWTPSTFVSSRSERAKKAAQRPEDYMDEEDLQEIRESRVIVDGTEQMDMTDGAPADQQEEDNDPISAALASTLRPPPKESVGAKILMRMGWRLGQGIGPRVTLKERKLQDLEGIDARTGTRLTGDVLSLADDDEEANKHTYARRDTPVLAVPRKDNSYGLGYNPGMGLNESLGVKGNKQVQGPTISAGFGLGALNDADDDDIDIYDASHSSRNRVAFDHLDHDQDDKIVIGGKSERFKKPEPAAPSTVQTFHDGRPVLSGFVLADGPAQEEQWHPLPDIPPGWKPDPRRVWEGVAGNENVENRFAGKPSGPHDHWRAKISAEERGAILGETAPAAGPRSVFDYMSQKDRERLRKIAAGEPETAPPPASIVIPRTEPQVAQAALRGFQPFTADPAKQARYTAYLHSQLIQDSSAPQLTPLPDQGVENFNKELEDYAKAALLFKPISGAMAGRFTSASVVDHGPKIHEGLHTPSSEELAEKEAQRLMEAEANLSPKAHAAKMGIYGPLTRESVPWQPARLLCKRFGVKDPEPVAEADAEPANAGSKPGSLGQEHVAASTMSGQDIPDQRRGPRALENIGLGEDETQGQDILTYERPSMDIFKAIFASDEEDSDEEAALPEDEEEAEDVAVSSGSAFNGKKSALEAMKNDPQQNVPVDLATFKPTFIPRTGKSKAGKDGEKSEEKKDKKDKKDKKKKEKKGVLVSFEVDDEELSLGNPSHARPKKKRKEKKKQKHDDADDAMWANAASELVKRESTSQPQGPPPVADLMDNQPQDNQSKGRKKAIDFM